MLPPGHFRIARAKPALERGVPIVCDGSATRAIAVEEATETSTSIERMIASAVREDGGQAIVTLPGEFQGLPDTAHGGSVLGLFDALAGLDGPREVSGVYRRRVPLGVPLALSIDRAAAAVSFALGDARGALVDGRVACGVPSGADGAFPTLATSARQPLPIARRCLACGVDNPVGLRVVLGFDADVVAAEYVPGNALRRSDGTVTPLALTTLLDETAFWLGALASGESGMTTELRITLHRPVAVGTPLVVSGRRAATAPVEGDPRYWRTTTVVHDPAGHRVASGRITFVAVRGAAKKLALAMLDVNPRDVVHAAFPAYA